MSFPLPTLDDLRYARQEFERIEPRDFFYWSVTKLVNAVIGDRQNFDFDELVRALMMLLTTWNKNYYRFFQDRQPDKTMKEHFNDLQTIIELHNTSLMQLRQRRLESFIDNQDCILIMKIFSDFAGVLGRVGAAKCLHLLAPQFFPLWDAAILQGYGLEKASYRHATALSAIMDETTSPSKFRIQLQGGEQGQRTCQKMVVNPIQRCNGKQNVGASLPSTNGAWWRKLTCVSMAN